MDGNAPANPMAANAPANPMATNAHREMLATLTKIMVNINDMDADIQQRTAAMDALIDGIQNTIENFFKGFVV